MPIIKDIPMSEYYDVSVTNSSSLGMNVVKTDNFGWLLSTDNKQTRERVNRSSPLKLRGGKLRCAFTLYENSHSPSSEGPTKYLCSGR